LKQVKDIYGKTGAYILLSLLHYCSNKNRYNYHLN
jgi:hypothetical protein